MGRGKFKKNLKRTRVLAVEEDGIFLSPRRRVASRERERGLLPSEESVRFEGEKWKKEKKRKERHESRGDGSCSSFMRRFFPPGSSSRQKSTWRMGDARLVWTISSSGNSFFRPAAKEDRNPADEGEIAGTGIEGETFEGIEEDRTNETGTVGKVVIRFVISSESASREAIFRKIDLQRRARKVIFF